MKRGGVLVTGLLAAFLSGTMAGAQPVPAGKLFLEVAGSGSPTVVLESGLGDSHRTWRTVFPALAGFTRVVAYDRAGYGRSEPSSAPRSFDQVATELHAALGASGIAPPYVLVGHSLGGAYVRAFAHLFKNEVAGLVLVDPLTEDAFRSADIETAIREQESYMAGAGPGLQAEWAFLKEETRRDFPGLRALGRPPDVPMAVLIARRDRPPKWVTTALAQYGPWVADATEAQLAVVADSGHHIQADDPQAVVAAVRRVVFPSVTIAVERALASGGAPAAIDAFRRMKARYPAEYVSERTLNTLGYRRLGAGQADDAIALFKLNVEAFPDSANAYDSLGEGYATKGDREAAIASYRRSLALDPANTGAVRALRKLEEGRVTAGAPAAATAAEILTGGVKLIPINTPKGTFRVWTKRVGDNPRIKVLLLHGGPGATHEYFEAFESYFPAAGIEFYYYDQLGSAYSDQPDEPALWQTARFVEEVEQVRQALGLNKDNFYLLGHSWGGILAMEYALKYQQHLKGLVISNMMASIPAYNEYARRVLMPAMDQGALKEIQQLEAEKKYDDPRYMALLMPNHYEKHILRRPGDQWPDPVNRAFGHLNKKIYIPMQGPSELGASGTLEHWDRTADLGKITVPTLVIGAAHDTMDPAHMEMMSRKVGNGRYLFLPNGSHMAMYDDQRAYFAGLIRFLRDVH